MVLDRRQWLTSAASLGALGLAGGPAWAQAAYPNRPIRIIVPFGSGSGSDATARYFSEKLAPILGQSIYVENKPGADGAIGMLSAKGAPADGYTLVQGGISPSVVNAVLVKDLAYDPVKDFVPLLGYGRNMNVLVTANESRLKTFADVQQQGRAATAPLNVGTFSTTLHLAVAWLGEATGVPFTSVPYKGQSNVLNDVIGQQLDLALVDLGGASPLLRSGKLRALAVTGEKRSPDFPDIPTVLESGVPGYVLYSWNAFYVRSGTPAPIRERLADAIHRVMTSPETIDQLYRPKGTEGIPLSAEQMRKLQLEEIERFRQIAGKLSTVLPR
ncbi:tripartite tricarboxylate transporter substrate binding protein [Aquincola sp. MAHUQ-54]|uniref:Tripartite tricarboxylate transporter substrate binding protein n=1 Tax=Aquincola agrisoli TaxID=3119538 RepID=A0AAW9Q0C6_9BURK